ncbi:SLC13 family permease [Ponticaulis sp.]|uniref:SLC13 family permease n=1 Tax=Ponticaulis sp. TaxID=2020902 RepID=UPI000B72AEE0|nr:SLC13 family permease [Ponticaulis sp.]MAI91325.1 hypothetical protein [Ponticaulis sp.]OUX97925.1 MAG: hypothetical protein CBB65_12855 [Hyphomonadaceae bacterium TMED5]
MAWAGRTTSQTVGLVLGPVLALAMAICPVPEGLTLPAWHTAALLVLMAVWWATEAIPIPATALLPLIVIPLIGAGTAGEAAGGYSSTIVLLLLGGFVVAMGIERWNLHTRIALNIVSRSGNRRRFIIAGFMMATALISAWISNTATTLMMVPIAMSVASETGDKEGFFTKAVLLGICYSASIGGVATPIGTPTNLIAIDWLRTNTGEDIGYFQWMAFGVPAMLLLIPLAWFVVTRGLPKRSVSDDPNAAQAEIREHLRALGSISKPEARVAMVFGVVATLWVLRVPIQDFIAPLPGMGWLSALGDMGIAAFGAVLMFLVPAGGEEKRSLITWEEAVQLPWGVILLFGGGISLGQAVSRTGLSEWLGNMLTALEGAPAIAIVLVVVALVVYLTELTSNVATMTTLAPILGAFAMGIGIAPESLLGPAAVAASCAFMLPVATAPNAIVYASGHMHVKDMIRAGFWINAGAVLIITLIGTYLAPLAL